MFNVFKRHGSMSSLYIKIGKSPTKATPLQWLPSAAKKQYEKSKIQKKTKFGQHSPCESSNGLKSSSCKLPLGAAYIYGQRRALSSKLRLQLGLRLSKKKWKNELRQLDFL